MFRLYGAAWALSCLVGFVVPLAAQQGSVTAGDAGPEKPAATKAGSIRGGLAKSKGSAKPSKRKMTAAGRSALRVAAAVDAKVRGLAGAARGAALTDAAVAYARVLSDCAADAVACARAHFAIGEIQRRLVKLDLAAKSYALAESLDANRWAGRAGLQRAHMLRRLERFAAAGALYRVVAKLEAASARGHAARIGICRCLLATGDTAGAIASYRSAISATKPPVRVIDLCDRLASLLVRKADLTGAAAAIARADALKTDGAGAEASRVRKALARMASRRALRRARDRKHGSAKAAVDVEASAKRASTGKGASAATSGGG